MPSELGGGGGGAAASSTAPSPLLWSSNTSARDSAAPRGGYSAVLQDSGSLQVRNGGEVLWDSFWNPTDTMLPGMQIAVQTPAPAGRASNGRMLFTSWASETDPAPGRYALGLDPVGFDQAYIWRDGNAIFWSTSSP